MYDYLVDKVDVSLFSYNSKTESLVSYFWLHKTRGLILYLSFLSKYKEFYFYILFLWILCDQKGNLSYLFET